MFLFVKDEQEATASSIPNIMAGYTAKTVDGKFRLSELLTRILFEVGHPKQKSQSKLSTLKKRLAAQGLRLTLKSVAIHRNCTLTQA